jgi:hypothetical protein
MKSGGKYTYAYADLAGVWEAAKGPLSANGLALVQLPTLTPGGLTMTTILMHSSGEFVRGDLENFPVPDRTPQGVGTAITYARRYTFGAMTGVVSEEDDDGGNGGKPKAKRSESAPASAPSPAQPRPTQGRQAPASDLPTTFPGFGSQKGKPLAGAKEKDLQWYAKILRENVADPAKARFKADNAAHLAAIERLLGVHAAADADVSMDPMTSEPHYDNEPPPPGDEDSPF